MRKAWIGLAAGLATAIAAGSATSEQVPWSSIQGRWDEAGPSACAPRQAGSTAWRLQLDGYRLDLAGSPGQADGTVTGWRAITPTRWYLDIAGPSGDVLLLDVVKVADGRLLVATRPRGEARWLVRCPQQ